MYSCEFLLVVVEKQQIPGVCPEEDKERAKSDQNCGFLLSDSSPFKACTDSKTVDFNKMYSSCEFDVCFRY
jgi:hypothetical protein